MRPTPTQDPAIERQRAARALLARPLLTTEAEEFRLVRRHQSALASWFTQETGWRLTVDAQAARLFKVPATLDDPSHPARAARTRVPFTRRRYVLLCLALAELERADTQVTLGRMAEGVLTAAADPALIAAGVEFRLDRREERSDLVAIVRALLEWGVLARVHGDEESYLADAGNDVLYGVERRVLAGVLGATRGPSTVTTTDFEARLVELTATPVPDTDESRLRSLRHQLTRRLLDEPVLYYAELSEDERAYLVSQRHAICRRITELTGLVAESRAEGIAMVDPEDTLTDVRMPERGTDGHLTLLLATHIASGDQPRTIDELRQFTRMQADKHQAHWRKGSAEPAAVAELVSVAVNKLEALNLIHRQHGLTGETIEAKPAIARYALTAPTLTSRTAQPKTAQPKTTQARKPRRDTLT